jgi:hypothetical protein
MNLVPERVGDASPQAGPPFDMSLYEQLIGDGIADADRRGGAVDHLTARRLAIWLAARPQQPDFDRSLDQFTQTGAISKDLRMQLRMRARSADYPHRAQAYRLVQYCASREGDLGPLGPDFGAACDRIDRADAMLAGLRDRVRQGTRQAARPETLPRVTARAGRRSGTVSLTLDEATANLVIYAIAADAGDREAHAREVEQFGRGLPEGSYGRRNREVIAAHEMHAARRLRAVERAYQTALDHDAAISYDPASAIRLTENSPDREIELE